MAILYGYYSTQYNMAHRMIFRRENLNEEKRKMYFLQLIDQMYYYLLTNTFNSNVLNDVNSDVM